MDHRFYVYILANANDNVLYVGSTGELKKRIYLHRNRLIPGFTKKYNVVKLVYMESCLTAEAAFKREHQLKSGSRIKKINLIESMINPWKDMFNQL